MAAPAGAGIQSAWACLTCVVKSHSFPLAETTVPLNMAPSLGHSLFEARFVLPVGSGRQNIPVQPGPSFFKWNSLMPVMMDWKGLKVIWLFVPKFFRLWMNSTIIRNLERAFDWIWCTGSGRCCTMWLMHNIPGRNREWILRESLTIQQTWL